MKSQKWCVLAAVLFAFMPIVIDTTILHIALPSLTLALAASGDELLWIIDIYPLMLAGLLVPMGTLSDRVGQKRMLLTGLVIFLAASIAAAFCPTAIALIVVRAFMAIGGAMVIPSILAIIRHVFDNPVERSVALGLWGTVSSAGAAIGPIAGGLLLEHFWWGAVFLVNLPIILVLWPIVFRIVPEFRSETPGSWKIGHALLLIAGLILTVYGLKGLAVGKTETALNFAFIAGGIAIVWQFVHLQRQSRFPMLDLSLFSNPVISVGIVVAMIVCGALAGVQLTIAQELQYVLGKSPLEAGLFMLPLIGASAVGSPLAGFVVTKVSLKSVMTLSLLMAGGSLLGLAFVDLQNDPLMVAASFVILGMALGMGLASSSIAIMNSVPEDKAGSAGALESTGYELGIGLGVAIFGGILSSAYRASIILPDDAPKNAVYSIGETFSAAAQLSSTARELLVHAGKLAFVDAHKAVLLSAAMVIVVLSAWVWHALRKLDRIRTQH
ncbi:MFS transporter [Brucella anthropi]|uniref:MFS transporter n=1 Tax=Brucella anthropi TaxID=529 RepID=UPI0039869B65